MQDGQAKENMLPGKLASVDIVLYPIISLSSHARLGLSINLEGAGK